MRRILIVEDEAVMAELLRQALEEARYQADVATDGVSGLQQALDEDYALILLDVMLPGQDGWTVCRELRARRRTVPILMLTARDSVPDRVRGLEGGADDYLPKPFEFAELIARVRALLRRDRVHKASRITVGDLTIDTAARQVWRGGQEAFLTEREYTLLEALAANEGRILSREQILERVWMDSESSSNTVEVHMRTLRRKMDTDPDSPLIHTVRGLGYVLRRPATYEEMEAAPEAAT
jgi:two-component system copper resistance phosphate regulon response regulator CusR